MKIISILFLLALSFQSMASDCLKELETEIHAKIAKKLKISSELINTRHLGGETMDGDYTSEGLYLTPSQDYFDVTLKSKPSKKVEMFLVTTHEMIDEDANIVSCEIQDIESVPTSEWNKIYRLYL